MKIDTGLTLTVFVSSNNIIPRISGDICGAGYSRFASRRVCNLEFNIVVIAIGAKKQLYELKGVRCYFRDHPYTARKGMRMNPSRESYLTGWVYTSTTSYIVVCPIEILRLTNLASRFCRLVVVFLGSIIVVRRRIQNGANCGIQHVLHHQEVRVPYPLCILPVCGLVGIPVVEVVVIPTFRVGCLEPNLQRARAIVPSYPLIVELGCAIPLCDGKVVRVGSGVITKVSIASDDESHRDISRRAAYLARFYSEFLTV